VKDQIQDDVPQLIAEVQHASESWTAQRALTWAFDNFGRNVAISSAFGAEGMVLIDMASRIRKDFRLFTIDTEFLFAETYDLMDRIEEKYGIAIEKVYSSLSPEEQERTHGAALWTTDPQTQ
jgi:phosphoadenosine phosphosulfate reductase